jgi:hypothetical protein
MMTPPSILPDVVFLYVFIGVVWLAITLTIATSARSRRPERRLAARLALASPVWPLAALLYLILGLLGLIKIAKD